ncbi:unnamed protein product [Arabidopsis lyrata]|nr:unnamed protein product [Arabidopsis lyrata]
MMKLKKFSTDVVGFLYSLPFKIIFEFAILVVYSCIEKAIMIIMLASRNPLKLE